MIEACPVECHQSYSMGAINPVRNLNTPSTFFQPMDFYWSSSVISNGVKELG
jgi:hypothetical protein